MDLTRMYRRHRLVQQVADWEWGPPTDLWHGDEPIPDLAPRGR